MVPSNPSPSTAVKGGSHSSLQTSPATQGTNSSPAQAANTPQAPLPEVFSWVTFGLIVTAILNLFQLFKGWNELNNQKKLFTEGQNLKERDDIRYKLNSFFGPMKELRTESRLLYDLFAINEKKNVEGFRTLSYLVDGNKDKLSKPDQAFLEEIIVIGKKQLDLIEKEGWAVRNILLTDLLGKLGSHIRVLIMANDSKLNNATSEIKSLVFPKEIDGALETEVRRLQDRYNELLESKTKENRPILNNEQNKTIDYYNRNHLDYFRKTAFIDLSDIHEKFKKQIPRGALILDAGCGVGRDTRYFIMEGYRVISFDASEQMVKLCRQYPFAYCLHRSFEQILFTEEFDAVWACASLVHLPESDLKSTILKLSNAIRPGGVFYFSLKLAHENTKIENKSENVDPVYYLYAQDKIEEFLDKLSLEKIEIWINNSKKKEDICQWANYLYRKPGILSV
jgi:SAM-dependent methyltransferase